MEKIAICITGWHYNKDFYRQISQLEYTDIFVISHKSPNLVPNYLYDYIPPEQVFFEPNIGYDWGCYQQFLKKGYWTTFDYIFFMHDDIIVKDGRFIHKCIELLNNGHSVIGNGRVTEKQCWPEISPQSYAHSSWKPFRRFRHDVVRGSFFATTREALESLGKFEVFWDPYSLTSGFGNWSTKASCGKWEYLCGDRCFQFLSEQYCESDYLVELIRGAPSQTERENLEKWLIKPLVIRAIRLTFGLYMLVYWKKHSTWRHLFLKMMTFFIQTVSARKSRQQ